MTSITRIGRLGRKLPIGRISAYECNVLNSGEVVVEKYVTGWYRTFSLDRLRTELMPKLAEYACQGRRYPFLITSHQLNDKAEVWASSRPDKKARASDIKFSPRTRNSSKVRLAIIRSPKEFELF